MPGLRDTDATPDGGTGRVAQLEREPATTRTPRRGTWLATAGLVAVLGSLAAIVYLSRSPDRGPVAAPSSTGADPGQLAALLAGTQFDYEPSDSPRELATWVDGVVIGTFESVADGYVEYIGGDVPVNHVTFAVRVEDVVWGSASDLVTHGRVYLDFTRAGNTPVDAFREAMPTGSVLLFIAKYILPPGRYENEGAGIPEGASLYFVPPEGFWVAGEDGDVPVLLDLERPNRPRWGEVDTIEEIAATLRD